MYGILGLDYLCQVRGNIGTSIILTSILLKVKSIVNK